MRECPDFAEKGECSTRGCKLPHVIRANRNRKPGAAAAPVASSVSSDPAVAGPTANDAKLGDEFISLTFNESESSEDEDDEDEEEGDDPMDDEEPLTVEP